MSRPLDEPPDQPAYAVVTRARARGCGQGPVHGLSWRTRKAAPPTWRLTCPRPHGGDGLVPFVIDWGGTWHPATGPLSVVPSAARPSLTAVPADTHGRVTIGRGAAA